MRNAVLALVALCSACATTQPKPVANIPAIRHQIDEAIAADPSVARRTGDFHYESAGDAASATAAAAADPAAQLPSSRRITAMGRVTPDRAVVYTRPGASKLEETWVRQPDGWVLAHVTELAPTGESSSAVGANRSRSEPGASAAR